MTTPPHSSKVTIPEPLRLQLADFRRHLWKLKIIEAIAAGVIGLLISFLLVYGLDRIWPTPGWARLLILICGISLFGVFAPYTLHRWVWNQRRENQLARLIAKRYPGLGDRLLGVIELQHQEASADSLSPRLRQAAMEAVTVETGTRKLDDALPGQKQRIWTLTAIALSIIASAAFTLTPRAGINALQRWLMPFSQTERYTFTKLKNPPTSLAVAYGEAFELTLKLAKESEQRPTTASGRYAMQPELNQPLQQNQYHFIFPGQQDPGTIVFHVGDLLHEIKVTPVPRPTVENARAILTPPDYLGIPERNVELTTGVVSAVEGSKIRIKLTMSRSLTSGTFGPTRELQSENDKQLANYSSIEGQLSILEKTAMSSEIAVATKSFDIPFSWIDELGLAAYPDFRLRVDALKDTPPTCYLQGTDRQKVMLPEETIDFEVLAEDDFGVKTTGIEWSGEFSKRTADAPAKGELKLAKGAPEERRLLTSSAFSPLALGIPPQKISLRAYSEDYFPKRTRVYSDPIVIYVMTRDEHSQLLKSQFDRQITELEDLARREQDLLDENERINRLEGDELQKEENRKRLDDQKQKEDETKRRMDDLTKQGEQLMKDAARNGSIDQTTLQKMAESLKSIQELSKEDVPKVQKKLERAQENSNTSEQTKKDVHHAVIEQKLVVEKMKEAILKANDANTKFEAGTFVNRLKKAAAEENNIVDSLKEAFDRMLGLKNMALDPSDTRRVKENACQQTDIASDVRWIQEDLGHYYARTKNEPFKLIYDEMHESNIDSALDEIRASLANNFTYQAAEQAIKWSDQLKEWAKKLEKEKEKSQGGSSDSAGKPPPEDEDFEFMLRVMKLIQQEQDLRAHTRFLEQIRRNFESQKIESATPDTKNKPGQTDR